ncbi:MAG: sulfite oxidase [Anaerolineales bacterium]|nr:sulfite oxidase [Anaerolineales bacterium]
MEQNFTLQPVTEQPLNAETPLNALNQTLTPTELFYIRNHFDIPVLDSDQFELIINGAVAKPLGLTLSQLHEYPEKSLTVVMECAGNGRSSMRPVIIGTPWNLGAISQAIFTGIPLHNILEAAHISEDTKEIRFTGADVGLLRTGKTEYYVRSLPLEIALHPDTILVWEMNGERLSAQHGFPLRLVVPGWYGMASVKWLREITVLTEPFQGFFQTQEYIYIGEQGIQDQTPVTNMRVRSMIIDPDAGSSLRKDEILLSGIAWSGDGEVVKVELSFDGGESWSVAALQTTSSTYEAARWEYNWQPKEAGRYTIITRAADSSGNVQPLESLWNKGGYGNNVVHQITLSIE